MSFSLRKDNCFNVELMMWWWKFYFRDVFLTFQRCETYLLMVKRKISMPMIFLKRHKNRIFCQNPGDLRPQKSCFFLQFFGKSGDLWWPFSGDLTGDLSLEVTRGHQKKKHAPHPGDPFHGHFPNGCWYHGSS